MSFGIILLKLLVNIGSKDISVLVNTGRKYIVTPLDILSCINLCTLQNVLLFSKGKQKMVNGNFPVNHSIPTHLW